MFALKTLDHVVLRVANVAECIAFYTEALGCRLEVERRDLGLFQLRAGSALIDLIDVDGKLGRQGGGAPVADGKNVDHFCLRIEPFDEAELRRHFAVFGVAVSEVANNYGAEGRGPSVYINDPAGNSVELKGPATEPPVGSN